MSNDFKIINQHKVETAWQGAALDLAPGKSVHMPETPAGPLIFVYQIAPDLNEMGSLTLTSGASIPTPIMIQPGSSLPGIYIRNWGGADLGVTNISASPDTKVSIAAFGVMPATEYEELPWDKPVVFPSQHRARCNTVPGLQQVVMQAKSSKQTLFAIIFDRSTDGSKNAKVFTMNTDDNTGPGTERETPPGYYSTTTAKNSSFEVFAAEGDAPIPLYLMNISPDGVVVDVYIRRL
jgi:hypothetical protein